MIRNLMSRSELIAWLGNVIKTELEKPFEEIDYDLVDECGNLLDELMDASLVFPREDMDGQIAEIQKKVGKIHSVGKKKRSFRYAIIAAALFLCVTITVFAVIIIEHYVSSTSPRFRKTL